MLRVGRADTHIHTLASDGTSSMEEVVSQALERELDVIAITDHNTVASAYEVAEYASEIDLDVIIGSEISSSQGHILGLWITEDIAPGMTAEETINAIHAQGGLAVIAHPFANRAFGKFGLESVGEAIRALSPDAIEVYNSTPYMLPYANKLARRELLERTDTAAVGGSDAHITAAVGKGITVFPGTTAIELRTAIEDKLTDGVSGFASKLLTFTYLYKYRLIHKQQKVNLELCKPGSNGNGDTSDMNGNNDKDDRSVSERVGGSDE